MNYIYYLLIALAIAGRVQAEESASSWSEGGAAEPYAYGYEAPDHAAAEERTADGKVQGYYTLKDADGRSRRVQYYADESGFHANVETNEVGQKSSNPADVQVVASAPSEEQLSYSQHSAVVNQPDHHSAVVNQPDHHSAVVNQPGHHSPVVHQPAPNVQQSEQWVLQPSQQQQWISSQQIKPYTASHTLAQQPTWNAGVSGTKSRSSYQPVSNAHHYSSNYVYQVPNQSLLSSSQGLNTQGVYGGYNYHTPSSYYHARSSNLVRPVSAGHGLVSPGPSTSAAYHSVPGPIVGYSSQAPVEGGVSSSSLSGSSNYQIIQRRAA